MIVALSERLGPAPIEDYVKRAKSIHAYFFHVIVQLVTQERPASLQLNVCSQDVEYCSVVDGEAKQNPIAVSFEVPLRNHVAERSGLPVHPSGASITTCAAD